MNLFEANIVSDSTYQKFLSTLKGVLGANKMILVADHNGIHHKLLEKVSPYFNEPKEVKLFD